MLRAPVNTGQMGTIYTICLDQPLGGPGNHGRNMARHYTGWAEPGRLQDRLAEHGTRKGSKMLAYARQQGIGWTLVATEDGDRNRERQLKGRAATERCPRCQTRQLVAAAPVRDVDRDFHRDPWDLS